MGCLTGRQCLRKQPALSTRGNQQPWQLAGRLQAKTVRCRPEQATWMLRVMTALKAITAACQRARTPVPAGRHNHLPADVERHLLAVLQEVAWGWQLQHLGCQLHVHQDIVQGGKVKAPVQLHLQKGGASRSQGPQG